MNCLVFTYLDFDKQVIFHVFPQGKGLVRNLISGKERERRERGRERERERERERILIIQSRKEGRDFSAISRK